MFSISITLTEHDVLLSSSSIIFISEPIYKTDDEWLKQYQFINPLLKLSDRISASLSIVALSPYFYLQSSVFNSTKTFFNVCFFFIANTEVRHSAIYPRYLSFRCIP